MNPLPHLDAEGRPQMVDIGEKADTERVAIAEGYLRCNEAAWSAIAERRVKKGDVLLIAELAGVQGAKRASDLIPLCHPLPIDAVNVQVELVPGGVHVRARVSTRWRTGVEMEALAATNAALLCVYDMVKSLDRSMVLDGITLLHKSGGRSGTYNRA